MKLKFSLLITTLMVSTSVCRADTLHGFCVSPTPTCSDNGTITPVGSALPNFGFWAASGPITGNDLLAFLVPNNAPSASSLAFTVNFQKAGPTNTSNGSSVAALVSPTAWTSGQLDAYLGISASPTNPIGAYTSQDAGATGFFVYTVALANVRVQNQANELSGPLYSLSGIPGLPLGTFIVDFDGDSATANSGALRTTVAVTTVPEPSSILLFGPVLAFAAGLLRLRRA